MALIFNDTFTEAAGTPNLQNHTPDTGTSWTELWATTTGTGWNVNSATDNLQQDAATSSGVIYTADAVYDSSDYYVQITMNTLSGGADDPIYLFLRIQDQENMYAVRLMDQNGTGTCGIYKKTTGTWAAIGSAFNPPADGSVVRFEVVGNTLKVYDDGVEVASVIDNDISSTGKAGLGAGGGAELITSTDDLSGNVIDSFSVTTTSSVTTSTSSTSSSISTSSTSTSRSTSTSSTSTSRSTSTSSTSISISTSSTSTSISTSSTSISVSVSTSSTSSSISTSISTSSTSRSTSTSSTSSSTSLSTSSTSASTSSTSTSVSFTTSTSSTSTSSTSTSTSSTSASTSSSTSTTLLAHDVMPIPAMKPISQTSTPTTSDSTIMDDTVVTMDSATALMGGTTSEQPAMRQTIENIRPRVNIRIRR